MAKKDEILNLNVGGKRFTVRRSDLCVDPRSRLAEWFKVGILRPLPMDKTGAYFLDRDGRTFRYVIAYLRSMRERVVSPVLTLPMKPDVLANLVTEAETLGLEDLRNDCLLMLQQYQREEVGYQVAYISKVLHDYEEYSFDAGPGPAGPKKRMPPAGYDEWEVDEHGRWYLRW